MWLRFEEKNEQECFSKMKIPLKFVYFLKAMNIFKIFLKKLFFHIANFKLICIQ